MRFDRRTDADAWIVTITDEELRAVVKSGNRVDDLEELFLSIFIAIQEFGPNKIVLTADRNYVCAPFLVTSDDQDHVAV